MENDIPLFEKIVEYDIQTGVRKVSRRDVVLIPLDVWKTKHPDIEPIAIAHFGMAWLPYALICVII